MTGKVIWSTLWNVFSNQQNGVCHRLLLPVVGRTIFCSSFLSLILVPLRLCLSNFLFPFFLFLGQFLAVSECPSLCLSYLSLFPNSPLPTAGSGPSPGSKGIPHPDQKLAFSGLQLHNTYCLQRFPWSFSCKM